MFKSLFEKLSQLREWKNRKRRPKASKWPIRQVYLDVERLEKREVFSSSPWLLQPPYSGVAAGAFGQDNWFIPLSRVLPPGAAIGDGDYDYSSSGTFSFSASGAYTFTLFAQRNAIIQGGDPPPPPIGTMTYQESGSATFIYTATGSVTDGGYSINCVTLSQTVSGTYTYVYPPLGNLSGTVSHNSTAFRGDAGHWYMYNWYGLVPTSFGAGVPHPFSYAWDSFNLNETGSSVTSAFSETGTAILTIVDAEIDSLDGDNGLPGNLPPGLLPPGVPGGDQSQSGAAGYDLYRRETYTYNNTGYTGTFALHEHGSGMVDSFPSFSLGSILYQERGSDTFSLSQNGPGTVSANGALGMNAPYHDGFASGSSSQANDFTSSNVGSFSYTESGAYSYTLYDAGTGLGTALNLTSVLFDETNGTSNATATASGTMTYGGTLTTDRSGAGSVGNTDNYGYGSFSSSRDGSSSTDRLATYNGAGTYTSSAVHAGSFTLRQRGTYAGDTISIGTGAAFDLTCVTYDANGTVTITRASSSVLTYSGSGTTSWAGDSEGGGSESEGGTSRAGNGSNSYGGTNIYSFSGVQTRSEGSTLATSFTLAVKGKRESDEDYVFNPVTYDGTTTGSQSSSYGLLETYSGSGSSTYARSGNGLDTTNYGGTNANGSFNHSRSGEHSYSYSGTLTESRSHSVGPVRTLHLEGSYANGSYAFNSVVKSDGGTDTYGYGYSVNESFSGAGKSSETLSNSGSGTHSYGGSSRSGSGAGSSKSSDSYAFSGSHSFSYTYSSATSATYYRAGVYEDGVYAFDSVTLTSDTNITVTYSGQDLASLSGTFTASGTLTTGGAYSGANAYGAFGGSGSGTVVYSAAGSFSAKETVTFGGGATIHLTGYATGTYALGCYSLPCVVFTENGTQTSLYTDAANVTLSGSGTVTTTFTGPGTVSLAEGGRQLAVSGTLTVAAVDSFAFTSFESDTLGIGTLGTYSRYEAGNYAGGSLAFASVLFTENATLTWSDASTGSATDTGGGVATTTLSQAASGTTTFGGEQLRSLGTVNYNSTDSYQLSANATWNFGNSGTLTAGTTERGVYSGGSYSINTIVTDDSAAFSVSDSLTATRHETGTGSSSYSATGTSSSLGTFGTGNWGGTVSGTYSGHDEYGYTDDTRDTISVNALASWSRHEEGSWSKGHDLWRAKPPKGGGPTNRGGWPGPTFSLTSVVYTENGNGTVVLDSIGTLTASGLGNWTSVEQRTGSASDSMPFESGGATGSETASGTGNYSFSGTTTYDLDVSANGSYANLFAGQYSKGSYSFSCVVLDEGGKDTYSLNLSDTSRSTGYAIETVSGNGTTTGSFADLQRSSSGTDSFTYTYTNAGTLSSTSTIGLQLTGNGSYSSHAAGVMSFGAYNLTTMTNQEGAASNDTITLSGTLAFDGWGTSSWTLETSNSAAVSFGLEQGAASGSLTAMVSSAYALTIRTAATMTMVEASTSSEFQAGVYNGGSYALSNVISDAAGTLQYDGTSAGTINYNATESFAITGQGNGNQTLALGSGGNQNSTATGSFAWTGNAHSNSTLIYSGQLHSLDTFSSHLSGSYSNGSYNLGCVLYRAGGSYNYTDHEQINAAYDGAGVLTVNSGGTLTSTGSFTGGNSAGTLTSTDQSAFSYDYDGTTSSTYDGVGSGTYGDYQSGQWSNGSYNLTCLTHSEAAGARETFNLTQVQSYEQTLVGTFAGGSQGTLTGSSGFNSNGGGTLTLSGTFGYVGTETLTLFTTAEACYSLFESGTSSGGCVSLGSIIYSAADSGEYAVDYASDETWTGEGTAVSTSQGTLTSGGNSGPWRTDDANTFSYELHAILEFDGDGGYSSSDYRAGSFAGGSYAFASVVHDEQANDSGESLYETTYEYEATGTWVNVRSGIGTSGSNGTFLYTASGSAAYTELADSGSSYTLHEAGTFKNGSFSLSCMIFDAAFTWNLGYDYENHLDSSNTTGFSSSSDETGAGSDVGWWNVHEEGTYANGTWNLGTFVEQAYSLNVGSSDGTWSQSATGQSATGTVTSDAAATLSLYRQGSYANGSWSFASLTLDYHDAGAATATESGSNASFTGYQRSDSYAYDYNLNATGASALGTYTETSLETTSRTFNGTLSGGGSINDSSLVTLGFTNTGTVSLASGELAFSGLVIDAPFFPNLPPIIDGLDVSPNGDAPNAPSFGGGMDGPSAGGGGGSGLGGSSGGDDNGGQQGGGSRGPGGDGGTGGGDDSRGPGGGNNGTQGNSAPKTGSGSGTNNGNSNGVTRFEPRYGTPEEQELRDRIEAFLLRIQRIIEREQKKLANKNAKEDAASRFLLVIYFSIIRRLEDQVRRQPNNRNDNDKAESLAALKAAADALIKKFNSEGNLNFEETIRFLEKLLADANFEGIERYVASNPGGFGRPDVPPKVEAGPGGFGESAPSSRPTIEDRLREAQADHDRQRKMFEDPIGTIATGGLDALQESIRKALGDLDPTGLAHLINAWISAARGKYGTAQSDAEKAIEQAALLLLFEGLGKALALARKGSQAARQEAEAAAKFVNCFPAGTLVGTEDGLKPIQDVRAADRVWAFDVVTGEWKLRRVIEAYRHEHDGVIVAATVAGEIIESTGHHPWWVVRGKALAERPQPDHVPYNPAGYRGEGRWVDAIDLCTADVLLLRSGEQVGISSLVVRQAQLPVYNFHVEELHCYAVGHGQVLVHNNSEEVAAKLAATDHLPSWHPDRRAALKEMNELVARKFGPLEAPPEVRSLSRAEARALADANGWRAVADPPFYSHGQPVFTDGKKYFTPDADGHIGGVWKVFDKMGRRLGTLDGDLNWIGK